MHLGISTYTFPWAVGVCDFLPAQPLTPNDLLLYAKEKIIHAVQFGDNLPLHLLPEAALLDLKRTASEAHIQIEVGTRRLATENINRYLAITKMLNSPFLRVVIDDANYHPDEPEVVGILKKLLPRLQQVNICLAIENHDRFPAKTLQRIIEQTDPKWIGICLDTANSLGAGEGINEVVGVLAPYTVNLHIKDFMIKRVSHKMGFTVEGCIAGEGMLNISYIIDAVKKHGRCNTATLEVWSNPEPTIQDTIAKEKQWVEKSLHNLKNILS